MENLQAYDVTILPIIVALVAGLTRAGMPRKLAPAASVILGILAGLVYIAPHDPKEAVLIGVALGLASVGLHSGAKNTIESVDNKNK